jgi:hypothetical protein
MSFDYAIDRQSSSNFGVNPCRVFGLGIFGDFLETPPRWLDPKEGEGRLLAFVIKPIPRNGIVAIFRRSNASIRLESLRRDAWGRFLVGESRGRGNKEPVSNRARCRRNRLRRVLHHLLLQVSRIDPSPDSRLARPAGGTSRPRPIDAPVLRDRGSLSPRREPAAGVVSFESTAVRKKYSCSPGGEDRCYLKARAAAGAAVDATAAQPHRSRVGIRRSTLIQTIDWSDRHSSPARRAASR